MSTLNDSSDVVALAALLRQSILRLSRRLRREAQKAGLSAQDALLLFHIKSNPGIGVSALAEAELTSKPTMSAHIARLGSAGLVSRMAEQTDGRRTGLRITEEGLRVLEVIRRERNDWLATRLAGLTSDERGRLLAATDALARLMAIDP